MQQVMPERQEGATADDGQPRVIDAGEGDAGAVPTISTAAVQERLHVAISAVGRIIEQLSRVYGYSFLVSGMDMFVIIAIYGGTNEISTAKITESLYVIVQSRY